MLEKFNRWRNEEPRRPEPPPLDPGPPLPQWLGSLFLRPQETVTMVRGPRWSPSIEPFLTHPLTIVVALVIGAGLVWLALLIQHPAPFFSGLGLGLGTLFVVGFSAGHFTRLVVTNQRLFIVQGREMVRQWRADQLPHHLRRYERRDDGREEAPTIDLGEVTKMLGTSSDGFADANTILQLGKKIDSFKERPDEGK
jgi:hypothetical protein